MGYLNLLQKSISQGLIPKDIGEILKHFYHSYMQAIEHSKDHQSEVVQSILMEFLNHVVQQLEQPFFFSPYHERIRSPIDYYAFGLNLFRPLIDFQNSKVLRIELIDKMNAQLENKDNVILFANHQIEPDPQVISLLLEDKYPKFAEEMIFVAGHRVVNDPLAVPMSMGRNLLCIYSKKHIDNPPELKQQKLLHNQKTMMRMSELLAEGGKCIYVAPSGGRDRPNPEGEIDVSPFDPQSIEMFWLISQQSKRPTHFYPLALVTYHLLPPPNSVNKELGEHRQTRRTRVHLAFNEKIDMEDFPGSSHVDKKQRRQLRAEYIWNIVRSDYQSLRAC